ncbi:short chain dehydrogenase reductase [Hypoxylon sp. NC1633]|nr:short chain dehydrogenase reductase [Hypoxylon sp. NC1633]
MSSRINTILILGAGGGIGEAMARRFHSMGKKVIVTGREENRERLAQQARDLPGLEFRVWDLTHLDELQVQIRSILNDFPNLDTVFINAGVQNYYEIFQSPPQDDAEVVRELTTNLTAPILVAQTFAPHLLAVARSGTKSTLFLTSSSLAYFPVPFYPSYCAAKAGIGAFAKILRMQLESNDPSKTEQAEKNMNVVEVVPPYVDTPLNAAHRDRTDALQGGPDKAFPPMPLDEYIDRFFAALEQTKEDDANSFKNEIAVGFAAQGVETWHQGYRKLLEASGMTE